MADDRTVLDHLLEARDALAAEVARLTEAIEQLDVVLARIGSVDRGLTGGLAAGGTARPAATAGATVSAPVSRETVNPDGELESRGRAVTPRRRAGAGRGPAKRAVSRTRRQSEPPKSIRVHVLDMLAAENREFGLAEIIDSVHDAGIQAHDDAVRSITIKLMKDGRVERVGRGQYRLARRGHATSATAPPATEGASSAAETQDWSEQPAEPGDPSGELSIDSIHDDAAPSDVDEHGSPDTSEHPAEDSDGPDGGPDEQQVPTAEQDTEHGEHHGDESGEGSPDQPWGGGGGYTPPLNLGQPWQG